MDKLPSYRYQVTVITDHQALLALTSGHDLTGKLYRWALTIQEIDPLIKYRPGRKNEGVDHLSHKEDYFTLQEELEKGPG